MVNPAWRKLDSKIRSQAGKRHRLAAQFGALALSEDPSQSQIQSFQQRKGQIQEEIHTLDLEIDLTPDLVSNTLTIRLHHLTQAAHDQVIEKLLVDLNATQTLFPGTKLTLLFKLGST